MKHRNLILRLKHVQEVKKDKYKDFKHLWIEGPSITWNFVFKFKEI